MSRKREFSSELLSLLAAACEGNADSDELRRLEMLAEHDDSAIRLCLDYFRLHAELTLRFHGEAVLEDSLRNLEIAISPPDAGSTNDAVAEFVRSLATAAGSRADRFAEDRAPVEPWQLSGSSDISWRMTLGAIASGWPSAYLIATVIVGVGLLIGSMVTVAPQTQVVGRSSQSNGIIGAMPDCVGRITNMDGCRWSEAGTRLATGDRVLLGKKYTLAEGLAEITYDTGAKIILQGPATYRIESRNGGYLSVGRLTGKVEMQEARGFSVRTPAVTVTDLGTEFGVDVRPDGVVYTRVFVGEVELHTPGARLASSAGKLRVVAGETAAIRPGAAPVVARNTAGPTGFVRTLSTRRTDSELAYWRFEDDVPAPPENSSYDRPQLDVLRDSSGHGYSLDYWPAGSRGMGAYAASDDVPPMSMFREGCSGGRKSFNSAALDAAKDGALFHDSHRHGNPFDFVDAFTIEGYFKTAGDQSAAGMMAIVYKDEAAPTYLVSVNRAAPGAAQFTLFGKNGEASATAADRNYADGRWHYFAARYREKGPDASGEVSLLVADEDGRRHRVGAPTTPGFAINWPDMNLFVGRKKHMTPEGHFRGLIDEIRLSRGALDDSDLLIPLKP